MKAPLPPDEAGRLADLHDYAVLDTPPEPAFDDLTLLAAQICQCPIAAITLLDEERQWFKSVRGLALTETSRDIAFCAHALLQPGALLQVRDAQLDPRFAGNPLVTSAPQLRAYVGAPLVSPQGHALGAICVFDTVPREFTHEEMLALQALGRQAVALFELRRQARELAAQVAQNAVQASETARTLKMAESSRQTLLSVIEDEKLAKQAQLESEARFLTFMNQSPVVAWIKDDQGRFRFVNLPFGKLFARESAQLLGHTDHEIYPREVAERVQADDRQVLQSGRTLETSEHVPGADGRMRHWLVHKFPLPRPGHPAWIGGSAVNVTEHKLAEEELLAKSRLLEAIVESSLHGILVVGPDGKKIFQNQRAIELWEIPPAIAADPDDQVQVRHVMAMTKDRDPLLQKVADLHDQPAATSHDIIELKNGTVLDRYSAPVIAADGKHHGRIWFFYDITERLSAERSLRMSEERLLEMVASSDAMVSEADAATFTFTAVSANAERLLGYPVAAWLQPDFWASHIHPDDRAQAVAYCQERTGQCVNHEFDYRFRAADGRVPWLRHTVKVVAEAGKPRWLRGMLVDITHTRNLEEQVRQAQKLQAVGTLAGGIAHDFNNILAGIYGFTGLARDAAKGNQELESYLGEISRAGRRAAHLVQQILAFSREPDGAENLVPVLLEDIVLEALQLLRATTPATVEFQTQVAKGLPRVLGNASQLHQVLVNFGTNAIHAMRHRPVARLTIGLEACTVEAEFARTLPNLAPGPCVRLVIEDNGRGMDAATQARIFEPFFTTKAPGEGSGLGLSVVYGIVRNHHGGIRVSSEIGRGSTFEIYLPASPSALVETDPELTAIPRGHRERILLVDDEAVVARSGQLALTHLGYAVVSETNVKMALARLERDPRGFDLVITDQTMPGITGLELAEHIRALRPELPVIIASGHSEALSAEAIKAAGVREILAKPYLITALSAAIQRHLPTKPGGSQPEAAKDNRPGAAS